LSVLPSLPSFLLENSVNVGDEVCFSPLLGMIGSWT
jgi:hypothetical protein